MFESVRKWLINTLIKPSDIDEYLANEYSLNANLVKVSRIESEKTEAAKKILLSKAIDILEMNLKGLENADEDNMEGIIDLQQRLRIYQDQLDLIEYREKQEFAKGAEIPDELTKEAAQWREQIIVGEVEIFLDVVLPKLKDHNLENYLYNLSGQFHQLMAEKDLNLVSQDFFEFKKIDFLLSLLGVVDCIQATRNQTEHA